jgi:hypothetical protein
VILLETPYMKHEGLQYFQSDLVKEQATGKNFFGYERSAKK